MEYLLRLCTMGDPPTISIDRQRFLRIKTAKSILHEALSLEEDYEMMISNYIDLEKESINVSISYMVRNYRGYVDFFDARLGLNRRLMNLFTSARLYADQLASHCSACLPNETGIGEQVKSFCSVEYDNNFDYRFMEALRNHVQHFGPAVHQVTHGSRWTTLDVNGLLEFSSSFYTEKEYLVSNGHFKKQILNEMPEKIDLISASRGFMESLSSVHDKVRQTISKNVSEARTTMQTATDDYKAVYKKEFVGLNAYAFDGNTKMDDVPIILDWDDIRIELVKRNSCLVNLRKRYVTGQIEKK